MSETKRSTWGSNATFILAAIGSAVGLGNAWRFPNLAAKHGGGAFLLVYVVALLVIGIPLLMMEISIGRRMRAGAPGALRGMNKKFEPIGWAATNNAFLIVTYYAVVFAWVIMMAVFSFKFIGMTGNVPEAAMKALNKKLNQFDLIEERDKYSANDVRPGLTGLAQINGRDELEIPIKAKIDGEYVANISFLMDLKCFFMTFAKVIKSDGYLEGRNQEFDEEEE